MGPQQVLRNVCSAMAETIRRMNAREFFKINGILGVQLQLSIYKFGGLANRLPGPGTSATAVIPNRRSC